MSDRVVGWYVEVPRSLKDKFDELYPGRRHKKILTITAIQYAIEQHPKSLYNLYKKEARSDALSDQQGHDARDRTDLAGGKEDGSVSGEHKPEP